MRTRAEIKRYREQRRRRDCVELPLVANRFAAHLSDSVFKHGPAI